MGVSGRKLARKQFDRMIDTAASPERPVHIIIVYNLSRFAHRLLTQVMAGHKLQEAGVQLVSVIENVGDDNNAKMMRGVVAVMNEKYAHDASMFTRRDRRKNALNGFWNGGTVPLRCRAETVQRDGDKERKKR